jgi:hypothetical protein
VSRAEILFLKKTYCQPLLLILIEKRKSADFRKIEGETVGYNRQIHCHLETPPEKSEQKKLALHPSEC